MRVSHKLSEFDSLSDIVSGIAEMYFLALKHVESCSEYDKGLNGFQIFVIKVNRAYYQLSDVEQEIINNDFFYEAYPNWWKKTYPKSSYYRLRKRSMKRFKEAFENEM